MKKMILTSLVALAPLASFAAQENPTLPLTLKCGRYLNIQRVVSIEKSPQGSWKPFSAELIMEGADPVTGTLTARSFIMSGSIESDEESVGDLGRSFVLVDEKDPRNQLIVQLPNTKGLSKAVFLQINPQQNDAKIKKLRCAVSK